MADAGEALYIVEVELGLTLDAAAFKSEFGGVRGVVGKGT